MYSKIAVLCIAFAVASGAPSAPPSYGAPQPSYGAAPPPPPPAYAPPAQPAYAAPAAPEPIPNYAYNYAVLDAESGNDFSAEEEAKDGAVLGQYKVLRADGIIMTVTYSVEGDSGFVADIATEAAPTSGYGAPSPPAYAAPLPTYA